MAFGLQELLLIVPVAGFLLWRRLRRVRVRGRGRRRWWEVAPMVLIAAALFLPPMPGRLPLRVAAISVAVLWLWIDARFLPDRR